MKKQHTIEIKIEGSSAKLGSFPAKILAETILNLQNTLVHLAKYKLGVDLSKSGPHEKKIAQKVLISLSDLREGSIMLGMDLCHRIEEELPGMPAALDQEVLEDFDALWNAVGEHDEDKIKGILSESKVRQKIVRDINEIIPSDDYTMRVRFGNRSLSKPYARPPKEVLEQLIGGPILEVEDRESPDVVVSGHCWVKMDEKNEIVKISDWIDYEHDNKIFFIGIITGFDKTLILKTKIECEILQEDDLTVILYSPLWMRSYGVSREEAIQEFKEEFIMLWEEYALEDDNLLSMQANQIKQHLLEIVDDSGVSE